MAVHGYSQHATAPGAAPLEDFATVLGLHPRAKAMDAHPTADLWLVCTFGHLILSKKTGLNALLTQANRLKLASGASQENQGSNNTL
jgi:hypothetical protein